MDNRFEEKGQKDVRILKTGKSLSIHCPGYDGALSIYLMEKGLCIIYLFFTQLCPGRVVCFKVGWSFWKE